MLLRLLFRVDSGIYRGLRFLVRQVDGVVPFGKRRLVLFLLSLYLLGEIGAIVTEHEALTWILGPMLVMGFVLYGLERGRRQGLEYHVPSLVLRSAVCLWMLPGAIRDALHHHPWQALASAAYVGLFYAIDMSAGPPRKRRRLLHRLGLTLARPGYSTG